MERGTQVRSLIVNQGESWGPAVAAATRLIAPPPYLFVGSGTSWYLAMVAAAVARRLGMQAEAAPAADVKLDAATLAHSASVVVISRSGTTTEALWAAEEARERGLPVMGLTCVADSPLASRVDQLLWSPAGDEDTVVMIRSFSSMLVLIHACLAISAQQDPAPLVRLARHVPALVSQAQAIFAPWADAPPRRAIILGSGIRYGVAAEATLKCIEMSGKAAFAHHPLEYRHGPWGSLTADDAVFLLAQEATWSFEEPLMRELADRTPRVCHVGRAGLGGGRLGQSVSTIEWPDEMDDEWTGPLAIVPLQWFAWLWAIWAGQNPDQPLHLTKVVELDG